jgi:hypothetical protein
MTHRRFQVEIFMLPLFAALFLATPETTKASDCPEGTVKIGEKQTETADAIIVQPVCKKIAAVPTECPPGSSVVGSGCMKDSSMRPEPSKKQKLAALRQQAQRELDEIRFHGFVISWEGVWTILSKTQAPEANSTAEDESNEMSKNVKAYLELEEQIEELTGDKAAAEHRLGERESHIKYVRTDGSYNVNLSKSAAPGQNYLPDAQTPLKATGPISGGSYVPGDVVTQPPLKDKRPIPPNGYKPGEDSTTK